MHVAASESRALHSPGQTIASPYELEYFSRWMAVVKNVTWTWLQVLQYPSMTPSKDIIYNNNHVVSNCKQSLRTTTMGSVMYGNHIYIYIFILCSPNSACTEGFWRFVYRGWWSGPGLCWWSAPAHFCCYLQYLVHVTSLLCTQNARVLIFAVKHDEKYNFLSQMHQGGPRDPQRPPETSTGSPRDSRCFKNILFGLSCWGQNIYIYIYIYIYMPIHTL